MFRFKRKNVSEAKNDNVKNYLLPTSEFGKHTQGGIDLYITRDRLNKANFRRKLDPITQTIICRQNSLEFVFKDNFFSDEICHALSEIYRSLSLQALSEKETRGDVEFNEITKLVTEINIRLQNSFFVNKSLKQ